MLTQLDMVDDQTGKYVVEDSRLQITTLR